MIYILTPIFYDALNLELNLLRCDLIIYLIIKIKFDKKD